jgi:hypothetical protein
MLEEESSASKQGKEDIIKELLQELPSDSAVEVELPSECRVYNLKDPGGPITIRPMTFEDEKNMLGSKEGEDPINIILSRCTTNLNVLDLLTLDKVYLVMKLREISYGDEYNTLLICRNCKAENPTTIKLSQLNVNPVPDDFEDPTEVFLPGIKKTAKVKFPRVRDEKLLSDPAELMDKLWKFIEQIGEHKDKSIIAPVLEQLPLKDARTILNAMKTEFGVDTKVKFHCSNCKEVSVVELPIDANFFDVS